MSSSKRVTTLKIFADPKQFNFFFFLAQVWLQVQQRTIMTTLKLLIKFKNTLHWHDYSAECELRLFQHSGSELVYTNTLHSVRPFSLVSRRPSLILPLACRIPGVQAKGPQYKMSMPTEKEAFGELAIWIEIHFPGQGPLSKFTNKPRFYIPQVDSNRVRREAESPSESNTTSTNSTDTSSSSMAVGSKITNLDLHVMSNCSIGRAEMIVSNCLESETEDFAVSQPIIQQGSVTIASFPVIGWGYHLQQDKYCVK